ncbi:Kinetochore protein NDC80 [Tetrabaena socialis]|uniref:Kinetochore protein NDC80 n=1 Tax=Tetrabaena socialis TaxID=47790 RepID=A0A2J7ZME3_9CHLO|nr:Kinetochore protein NDC80 [Tetrabaena socialis]|eukprot:PNH01438.1 Kinetochore protein NDC80 [Tetrabaena socialis]
MSRRQTLAGLSPSQLNTRSAAPGRNGKDGAALPAKGRKSLAVGLVADRPSGMGLDRRSSAFGTTKPGGPKQDPRPLNSKDYQAACIRTVITYLSTHSFPAAVSPKTLASPTGKDFSTIVTFLFQQVDPTFRIQSKVEDEVPVFFKRLNYPFQISKSALFAVGSPHSWPAVLAALTWLVELLSYMEKADDSSGPAFERENKRYNKLAHRLKLVPATSKRADGTNYDLRINRDATSQADFSNLDLKGVIKPGLERLCESYRTRASELSQDLISLREACVARGERNGEKREENAGLDAEIARLEAHLQAAKEAHDEKCRRLLVQADGIKSQIDEFRNVASNRTEHIEERLARAQAAYEQAKR